MIGPKQSVYKRSHNPPLVAFCQNPNCGAKLSPSRARKGAKYCDRVCQLEHSKILKLERRPKNLFCSNPKCGKQLDPLQRGPADWKRTALHFCDALCADEYRRLSGGYQSMGQKGIQVILDYKTKHGQVHHYKDRAASTARGNREAPPKSKRFVRTGKVWGYDVRCYPNENGDGYRVSVPELPELGILQAKTLKEGLKLMRVRFLEYRALVRSKQEQEQADTFVSAIASRLSDAEFGDLYNAFKAGVDPRKYPGYQKAAALFTEANGTRMPQTFEEAFERAMQQRFGG